MPPAGKITTATQRQRSRAGCTRCRHQRKRCDQQKPDCSRCQRAGSPCNYELNIKWGGRPFPKLLGNYAEKVQRLYSAAGDEGGWVYIAQPQDLPEQPVRASQMLSVGGTGMLEATPAADFADDVDVTFTESLRLEPRVLDLFSSASLSRYMRTLDMAPDLSRMHRFLLHHYVHETIRLTAPSDYVRTEICRSVVPTSFHHPCLLFALIAFAARHLHALGALPARHNSQEVIAALEDCSMSSLRQQLTEPNFDQHAVALATTRTLCQAQIFAAGHSWRTHLEGARAILQAASCPHARVTDTETPRIMVPSGRSASIHDFLASWYNNVEALAALTPLGLHRGQLETTSSGLRNGKVYFDVFGGVASDLPDLFREVGALVVERRRRMKYRNQNENNIESILSDDDIAVEAEALVHEIHVRLERDAVGRLCLDSEHTLSLSHDIMHDYALSNAGFLHTALLYIHGAVQCLPMWAPEVRHSVQQIIHCSENMKSVSALSPRVLMATPLFTAGLWALSDARIAIKQSFAIMSTWMRMPHITRSSALLEYVWSKISVSRQHDVLTYLEESPEFLPY